MLLSRGGRSADFAHERLNSSSPHFVGLLFDIDTVTKLLAASGSVMRMTLASVCLNGIGPSRTDSTRVTGLSVFNRSSTRSSGHSVWLESAISTPCSQRSSTASMSGVSQVNDAVSFANRTSDSSAAFAFVKWLEGAIRSAMSFTAIRRLIQLAPVCLIKQRLEFDYVELRHLYMIGKHLGGAG